MAVAGLGDLNRDGLLSLVVGATGDGDGGPGRGAVYVLKLAPGFVSLCGDANWSCEAAVDGSAGNFTCGACAPGYEMNATTSICTDIDECATGTHTCGEHQSCLNAQGSFTCIGPEYTCGGVLFSEHKIGAASGGLVGPLDTYDEFGHNIGSLGDVDGDGIMDLAVGAIWDNDAGIGQGAVYILFMRADRTVRVEAKISNPRGIGFRRYFGSTVAGIGDLDGDGVPDMGVGARSYDDFGGPQAGSIVIVFLTPRGRAKKFVKISSVHGGLKPLSGGDKFGAGIAGLGDLDEDGVLDIAVSSLFGAPPDRHGSVHVLFLNRDGSVKAEQRIDKYNGGVVGVGEGPGTGREKFYFPSALGDLNGDGIMDLGMGSTGYGILYILLLNRNGTVKGQHRISPLHGGFTGYSQTGDSFGVATAVGDLNGDGVVDIAISAPEGDIGGWKRGAVHALLLNPDFTVKALQTISSVDGGLKNPLDDNDRFGRSMEDLGDLDGDGIREWAVTAHLDDDVYEDSGAVYILGVPPNYVNECKEDEECVPTGVNMAYFCRCKFGAITKQRKLSGNGATFSLEYLEAGGRFGSSVSSVGDLDGDSIPDMAVSGWETSGDGSRRGIVSILFLNSELGVKRAHRIGSGQGGLVATIQDGQWFGKSVSGVGDLDGDGVGELMVSSDTPAVLHVLFLAADGVVKSETEITSLSIGLTGGAAEDLGKGMAGMGDLDGNGVPDVAVGMPGIDEGRGGVMLLFMSRDGTVQRHSRIDNIDTGLGGALREGDRFGSDLARMGDLDGDGTPDLVVAAEKDDDGGVDRGAVYVLFLNPDWTVKAKQKISSSQGGFVGPLDDQDLLGRVCEAGDLDGDGGMDLVVGAYQDDDGRVANSGAVYVLLLNSDGTVKGERKISATEGGLLGPLDDGEKADLFGASLAFLGVIEDGTVGLAVGAIGDDDGNTDAGAVYTLTLQVCGSGDE